MATRTRSEKYGFLKSLGIALPPLKSRANTSENLDKLINNTADVINTERLCTFKGKTKASRISIFKELKKICSKEGIRLWFDSKTLPPKKFLMDMLNTVDSSNILLAKSKIMKTEGLATKEELELLAQNFLNLENQPAEEQQETKLFTFTDPPFFEEPDLTGEIRRSYQLDNRRVLKSIRLALIQLNNQFKDL